MQRLELGDKPAFMDETEKMRVEFGEQAEKPDMETAAEPSEEELAEELRAKTAEIKSKIAERVRSDSQERSILTTDEDIFELDHYFRYGRLNYLDVLAQMGTEEGYSDIKTVVTSTGLLFAYSETYIRPDDAAVLSLIEEAKSILATTIRDDSRDNVKLTQLDNIYVIFPETDQAIIDALLKEMPTEAKYADITRVTTAKGEVYFHSDKYLVGTYATTLLMAMAGDHCATIAETVRTDARIYPRTTSVEIFRDQEVYGIPTNDLEAVVSDLLRRPEYSDIKKIVHPVTGAAHLYSDRYFGEEQAWNMMDWDEVGRADNP